MVAHVANSELERINTGKIKGKKGSGGLNGVTGDPWTPIAVEERRALTTTESGFSWEQMRKLMFGKGRDAWTLPLLATARTDDPSGAVTLRARAIGTKDKKTQGFHQREIIIPAGARARGALSDDDAERQAWADRAEMHAEDASTFADKILKPALLSAFEKGSDEVNFKNVGALAAAQPFLDQFDADVDAAFFPALWGDDGAPPEVTRTAWRKQLKAFAEDAIAAGLEAGPRTADRRFLAEARARRVFRGALFKNFEEFKPAQTEDDEMEAADG